MHYILHADAGPRAPALLLSSGLGGHASFWQPQLAALRKHHRTLVYDHRGSGLNQADLPDIYTIGDMAADAVSILDQAGIERAHFIGHALGGLIGLELARNHPERVGRLVVINGWGRMDPATRRCFDSRVALLQHAGVGAYIRAQPIFLYPAWWLSEQAARMAKDEAHMLAQFPGIDNTLRRIEALKTFDIEADLSGIQVPTLLVAAVDDILVPYTCSEAMHTRLPNSEFALLERGGHACTVTEASRVNKLLTGFLQP